MKNLSCLLTLIGGTAIGVVTGMLIAPDKGAETRCKIKKMMRRQRHFAQEHLVEFLKNKGITVSNEELEQLIQHCDCHHDKVNEEHQ